MWLSPREDALSQFSESARAPQPAAGPEQQAPLLCVCVKLCAEKARFGATTRTLGTKMALYSLIFVFLNHKHMWMPNLYFQAVTR